MATRSCRRPDSAAVRLQDAFLTILPRVERHAQIMFRTERCPGRRADRVAEAVALAWKWFRRLAERGKDATRFASALARSRRRQARPPQGRS